MNERDIFANTILAQKVASRYASQGSSTPSFDAAVKTDLEPKITPIVNRASKLADKAEDTKKPEELQKIAETSAQQAYLVLDMLRPVLSKGKGELGDVREDSPKVVKYASGLVDALKDPETQKRFAALMAEPVPTTSKQFHDFMAAERAKYEPVVKASGASVD